MCGLSLFLIIALSPFGFALEPMAHRNQVESRSQRSSNSDWFKGNKVRLNVKSHAGDPGLTFSVETNENNDGLYEIRGRNGKNEIAGTIIVVSGEAMLTRDLKLKEGYEIDYLDSVALDVQLALKLLSRAFPQGPSSVGPSATVNLVEKVRPIEVNTISAEGEIMAPWTLKGTAKVLGPGKVGFELSLSYTMEDIETEKETKQTRELLGTWEIGPALVLLDDMQLAGWQVYSLGSMSRNTSEGAIYDYGAVQIRDSTSLGELRETLRRSREKQR